MKLNKIFAVLSVLTMLVSITGVVPAAAQSGTVTQISNSGTASPITGEFVPNGDSQLEFPAQEDELGMDPYNGTIDRRHSNGLGRGVSIHSRKKDTINP